MKTVYFFLVKGSGMAYWIYTGSFKFCLPLQSSTFPNVLVQFVLWRNGYGKLYLFCS